LEVAMRKRDNPTATGGTPVDAAGRGEKIVKGMASDTRGKKPDEKLRG